MKRIYLTVSVTLAVLGGVAADPTPTAEPAKAPPKLAATTTRVKCSICQGKGMLKVSQPDVGQFGLSCPWRAGLSAVRCLRGLSP